LVLRTVFSLTTHRARYPNVQLNLIKLMPSAAYIKMFDNSIEAGADGNVPDPVLVLDMEKARLITPARENPETLQRGPEWRKAILEAALRGGKD
jgi:hypothetical protein